MTWCSWGMLASNLDKIATLLDERDALRVFAWESSHIRARMPPVHRKWHQSRQRSRDPLVLVRLVSRVLTALCGARMRSGEAVRDGNRRSRRSDGSMLCQQSADQTSFFRSK